MKVTNVLKEFAQYADKTDPDYSYIGVPDPCISHVSSVLLNLGVVREVVLMLKWEGFTLTYGQI